MALLALAGLLNALRQADARVATIAWRLQTANVALCSSVAPLPGFSVETIDQYVPSERAQARAEFGLADRPQISSVVPGSNADRAGLKAGDEIGAVNDVSPPAPQPGKAGYDRTAAVEAALNAALARPPVRLSLTRGVVLLRGDLGCASTVQLVPGRRFDASADGHYVQISGPMYEFARSDDELAFVIAHELAHNVVPAARLATNARDQRSAEYAADAAAIHMMAKAAFDVSAVPALMERLKRKRRLSWLDGTHPNWTARIQAAAEIVAAEEADASRDH